MPAHDESPFVMFEPTDGVEAYGRCLVVDGDHHHCRHSVVADTLEDVQDALVAHHAMVHARDPLTRILAAGDVVRRLA